MYMSQSFRTGRLVLTVIALAGALACNGKESPAAPAPTGSGLLAPTAKSPIGGVLTQTLRPVLEVTNVVASGTSGVLTYQFDVSELSDFPSGSRTTSIMNVAQGASSTSVTVPVDLVPSKLYYW